MKIVVRVCDEQEVVYDEDGNVQHGQVDVDGGVLTIASDGKTLYCPERGLTNLAQFSFDEIYPTTSSAAKIYSSSVAPLTPHVARGGHACVVVDGGSALSKVNTTLGQRRYEQEYSIDDDGGITEKDLGLVHFSVAQILSHLSAMEQDGNNLRRRERSGAPMLTLTWYELCGRHGIRDIFASAASKTNYTGNRRRGPTKDMKLVDDPGTGLYVPNLLEVAVESVGDVHRILQRVRDAENQAPAGRRKRHSVISINVKSYNGRLNFYMLGDQFKYDEEDLVVCEDSEEEESDSGGNSSRDEDENNADRGEGAPVRNTWSMELFGVLQHLKHRQPQKFVPTSLFEGSSVLLLLRQVLLCRMPSMWLLCVEDSIDAANVTLSTLRGASAIAKILTSTQDSRLRSYKNPSDRHQQLYRQQEQGQPAQSEQRRPFRNAPGVPGVPSTSAAAAASATSSPFSPMAPPSTATSVPLPPAPPSTKPTKTTKTTKTTNNMFSDAVLFGDEVGEADNDDDNNNNKHHRAMHNSTGQPFAILAEEKLRTGTNRKQSKQLAEWLNHLLQQAERDSDEVVKLRKRSVHLRRSLDRANVSIKELSTAASRSRQNQTNDDSSMTNQSHLQHQLKKTTAELHDFTLYKDVMEVTLARMNVEMTNLKNEREANALVTKKLKNKVRLANKKLPMKQTVVPFKVQQDLNELKNTVGALTFELEGERRRVASMKQVLKRHENDKMSAVEAVEMLVVETERIQREMKLVQDKNIVLTNTINEMNRNHHAQEEVEEREADQEGKEGKRNNRSANKKKNGKAKGKGNKNRHRNNNNEDNDDGKSSPTYSRSKVEELQRSVAMLEARNVMLERAVKSEGVGSGTSSSPSMASTASTTSSPASPSSSLRINTSNRQNMMVKDQIDRAFNRLTSATPPGSTTSNSSSLSSLSSNNNNQEEHDEATHERKEEGTSGTIGSTSGSVGNNDEEGELSTAAMLKRLKAKREDNQRFLAQRHKPSK